MHVIDESDAPIAGATVEVAGSQQTTDASGLVVFSDLVSRTGAVTLIAAIIDRDAKGPPADPADDTQQIIGSAYRTGVMVESSVNQSGVTLAVVETGKLETVTIDTGAPPAGLTEATSVAGIELDDDAIVQLPSFSTPTRRPCLLRNERCSAPTRVTG